MTTQIEYINNLTSKNTNIVIFVSNLSQLKNIDFLPNISFFLRNKNFANSLNSQNYIILSNMQSKNNILCNVLIALVKSGSEKNIKLGNSINEYFSTINKKDVSFIFSKNLISKSKVLISDIIFGYSIRDYNFKKYKNNNHLKLKSNLNLYKLKIFKDLKLKINLLESINFTKDLISEPANILNPITYADRCIQLRKIGLNVKILDKFQIEKIGMRSLLGVAQGSFNDPRVVIFEWNLKEKIKPTILVGKGVTFDTGGISIKSSAGMEEMITDMGGSAVVVGSMINAALNKTAHPLVGIIGLVENMPDGNAQRPGDIVTSLSGQTIEVLNTDAEGRLVLADIITYIQMKYKPRQIIDFATLTGAIMIALGTHKAGLFSNNNLLANKLEKAGSITGENIWRLPLGIEYDHEIDSPRADMKNIGSTRYGGSIQAAQFIQRFIKKSIPWAHLDIAGVSWTMKSGLNSLSNLHSPGATAFGVRLIDQFLKGK